MLKRLRESTFSTFREAGQFKLPNNHKPVLPVPRGGSMCLNCEYLNPDKKTCREPNFILYNGGPKLPYPADSMCSDWWSAKKGNNA
jgi:hypothetical protein